MLGIDQMRSDLPAQRAELLPRGATITTRIIAAIAYFGGLAISCFIAERVGKPSPPGIIAFPIAIVMLIAVEFLFLRHRYRKI